jgi:DNA-binding transcriptional regulator YhcF (GntR family)
LKIDRYRQIIHELRAELSSGKYQKGDVFPIRAELSKRFKTTRSTINRAVEILINDGLLTAQRGAGTVVSSLDARLKIAYVAPAWLMHYMPRQKECELVNFPYEEIFNSQTSFQCLRNFNGIIWSHPDENDLSRIVTISKLIPSVLVNRQKDGVSSVSSDYALFSEYASKLLARYPDSTPYFLSQSKPGVPQRQRYQAFVNACRKHKHFYENIQLPSDYAEKQSCLELNLVNNEGKLLLFADDWSHTGAVISWARLHELQFGKDIFYIDFDNTEPKHVWGMLTTSIIQDFDCLTESALKYLISFLEGANGPKNIFIKPKLRQEDNS